MTGPLTALADKRFRGTIAARGMASGRCVLLQEQDSVYLRSQSEDPAAELERLNRALCESESELTGLREKLEREGALDEAQLFDAHILFLQDESLKEKVVAAVRGGLNVEAAWMDGIDYFAKTIAALPDATLSARSADVWDAGRRVLGHLQGKAASPAIALTEPSIIVARDLAPSQTAGLDREMVRGFCTVEGGPNCHTAILAKALGLVALVGLGEEILELEPGSLLLVDGNEGELIANPSSQVLSEFQVRAAQSAALAKEELANAHSPAVTRDGRRIEIVANIGSREDALDAVELGAEGVGLLRTEFLYLNRQTAPDEAEQRRNYAAIFEVMGARPVVVRTLDIGGDKDVPYLDMGKEANPFLGWRAIRICLDKPEFFKLQLRALLAASKGHDIRIMFPMIATLGELRAAKKLLSEARESVIADGYAIASHIQIGIMVEIPSTVVLADRFAREVDFFSIGTNDLTQYTMAADRGNERVTYLGDPCHPAVLAQIKRVIEEGHKVGIWIGLCGELAGDPDGIPILLGLGLDEFSMAPSAIPTAKAIIRRWSMAGARQLAAAVLVLDSAEQVRAYVQSHSNL